MDTQEMKNKASRIDGDELPQADPTPSTPVFTLDDFTDYVAFHIKCDSLAHGSKTTPVKMSQKKCRFCD